MGDPIDVRTLLEKGDIKSRAAAIRAVALEFDWDDIAPLVARAQTDKSPSVRIYAAAAAADIAAHHKGAAGQPMMSKAQRAQIFEWMKSVDPGQNPGLLLLLAAAADAKAIDRIGRALRDPRNVVRAGAVAAIRRMALSGAAAEDDALASTVGQWIKAGKMAPDVVLELAKLVGECGWLGFDKLLPIAADAGRPHVAAVEEVLTRLSIRRDPEAWDGVWVSDGRDVLEPGDDTAVEWFIISNGALHKPGQTTKLLRRTNGLAEVDGQTLRMIFAPQVGTTDDGCALQVGGFTWWRRQSKDLVGHIEEMLDDIHGLGASVRVVAEWVGGEDGSLAQRARALVLWRTGAREQAQDLMERLCAHKRPRNDLFYWLAKIRIDGGDNAGAREAVARFLDKAGKKAAYKADAEALLASL
jgi:hypothetical protein